MQKFLALGLGAVLVICIFIFVIRMSVVQGLNPSAYQATMVSDKEVAFTGNDDVHKEGRPYLLEAKIVSRSSLEMTVDVMYVVPRKNTQALSLSVVPNAGGFHNSDNTLRYGRHTQRIRIHYSPDSIFKRGIKTTELHFYIRNKIDDLHNSEEYVEKVYERKVEYEKFWRKPKPGPLSIKPVGFIVKGEDRL